MDLWALLTCLCIFSHFLLGFVFQLITIPEQKPKKAVAFVALAFRFRWRLLLFQLLITACKDANNRTKIMSQLAYVFSVRYCSREGLI